MGHSYYSTGVTNGVCLTAERGLKQEIPEYMFSRSGTVPSWEVATELFVANRENTDEEYRKFNKNWIDSAWHHLYEKHKNACFDGCTNFALLVFSGDYELTEDTFFPPLSYLERLQKSKEARKKRLDRLLRDRGVSSHRIRIIGSDPRVMDELSQSPEGITYDGTLDRKLMSQDHTILGYPREFLGLYLSEDVPKRELYKIIQSHQRNCPIAREDETIKNQPLNESVINEHIWKYDGPPLLAKDEESQNIIEMLARRIPTLTERTHGISDIYSHRQKTATVIEAGGREPYRSSKVIM